MTEYVLSIDPGKSSGVALLSYDEGSVPVLEKAWQFGGGIKGFLAWYYAHTYEYTEGAEVFTVSPERNLGRPAETGLIIGDRCTDWRDITTVIAEKFLPRGSGQGFSPRADSLEPLRVEGALVTLGLLPDYPQGEARWRTPAGQYLVG